MVVLAVAVLSVILSGFVDCEDSNFIIPQSRVKDAFVKNDVKNGVVELHRKVDALENHAAEQAKLILAAENELHRETDIVDELKLEISEIRDNLNSHGENIDDLMYTASGDADNYFAFSNNSCGGILEAQKGRIKYTCSGYLPDRSDWNATAYLEHPLYCIWAINANHRPSLKLTAWSLRHALPRSRYYPYYFDEQDGEEETEQNGLPETYAVEILKQSENGKDVWKVKSTRLSSTTQHYVFSGPFLFLVYYMNPVSRAYFYRYLDIEFLAFGKRLDRKTGFTSSILNFTGTEYTHNSFSGVGASAHHQNESNPNKNYSTAVATTVLSEMKTRTLLFPEVGKCGDGDSVVIFDNLIGGNEMEARAGVDCCKSNCSEHGPFLITLNPGLLLVSNKVASPLAYNISTRSEKAISHRSYNYTELSPTCGGVVGGGVQGIINFEAGMKQRCVWTIFPSEIPKTRLFLKFEGYHPFGLYVMDFDRNGSTWSTEPRIRRVSDTLRYLSRMTLPLQSNQPVYLVYYSNYKLKSDAYFSLKWSLEHVNISDSLNSTSSNASAPAKELRHFSTVRDIEGQLQPSNFAPSRHSYVLVPEFDYLSRYLPLQLHLELETGNRTAAGHDENDCALLWRKIRVLRTTKKIFHNVSLNCDNTNGTRVTLTASEGMVLILTEGITPSIKYQWTQGNLSHFLSNVDNNDNGRFGSVILYLDNECGGIVRAERGIIRYRSLSQYSNLEQCIWLVVSPNNQGLVFDMEADGLETCCDYLVFLTFNEEEGTLEQIGYMLHDANTTLTSNTSFVAVWFMTDGSVNGGGFILHFEERSDKEVTVPSSSLLTTKYLHGSEKVGRVVLGQEEEGDEADENQPELVIFAYSSSPESTRPDVDDVQLLVKVDVKEGKVDAGDCSSRNHSLVKMYHFNATGHAQDVDVLGGEVDEEQCRTNLSSSTLANANDFGSQKNLTKITNLAFLVIYKSQLTTGTGNGERESVTIDWKKDLSLGCGDVIIQESGEIKYKLGAAYKRYERCIWLVEAPQASEIEFKLVASGLEACCDKILLTSINPHSGSPTGSVFLQKEEREGSEDGNNEEGEMVTVTMAGPLVAVSFSSDSSIQLTGFHLTFRTIVCHTDPLPYSFRLAGSDSVTDGFDVDANEMVVLAYSSLERMKFHHDTDQKMLRSTLDVFRPGVTSSCSSDKLRFYEFKYLNNPAIPVLRRSFDANTIINEVNGQARLNRHCSAILSQFQTNCTEIGDCKDNNSSSSSRSAYFQSGNFLAVYIAGNFTDENARGFKLTIDSVSYNYTSIQYQG